MESQDKPYGIIYRATNKTNGKVYIGQTTVALSQRKSSHLHDAKKQKVKTYFYNALSTYGLDAFEWEIIDAASSIEELDYMEKHWIRFYRSTNRNHGYNLDEGGGNGKRNDETKAKLSLLMKEKYQNGYVHPGKGKKQSEKAKQNFAEAIKTRKEEGGYVSPRRGVPICQDKKEKQRESLRKYYNRSLEPKKSKRLVSTDIGKGQHLSKATEFPSVSIQCVETGQIYASMAEAAREYNINHTNFSNYFKGKNKSVAGCQWIKL